MARSTEVLPGADAVSRSVSIKAADRVLRILTVKMEPVFYECSRDESSAGDVGSKRLGDKWTLILINFRSPLVQKIGKNLLLIVLNKYC